MNRSLTGVWRLDFAYFGMASHYQQVTVVTMPKPAHSSEITRPRHFDSPRRMACGKMDRNKDYQRKYPFLAKP